MITPPIGYLLEERVDDFIRFEGTETISAGRLIGDLQGYGIPWNTLPPYLQDRILSRLDVE